MTDSAPLTDSQTDQLVTALRTGQTVDDAATVLGLDLPAVWARARTDTRLTIALAGRDPEAADERARVARADYLRLLALGVAPTRAQLILGAGHPGSWRGDDPAFAQACDAVSAASAPFGYTGMTRLTTERVARFLQALSQPETTVLAAAAAVGVTQAAIYQRRSRDKEFATAMDEARAAQEANRV
ncbi:hypothetical protein ABZ468_08230 [Streptomyces sp. NPDC005708]|uniref:hypothetical protein n=1 Tax=Streptomyces sp. NPDC005708 TaxID=3154564 RepID=UPI0033C34008